MLKQIKSFLKNEEGATALEYALLAALIAVVIITAVTLVGEEASTSFDKIGNAMKDANAAN